MNTLVERDNFLRRMAALKEQNKMLEEISSKVHSYVFRDMDDLRSKVQE